MKDKNRWMQGCWGCDKDEIYPCAAACKKTSAEFAAKWRQKKDNIILEAFGITI